METELTEKQEEVVEVLREGRATPDYLTERTSIEAKQTIQYHLRELRARGVVRRVHTGLYELDPSSQFTEPRFTEEEFEFSPTRAGDG